LHRRDERASVLLLAETGTPLRGMPKNFMLAWLLVVVQHGDLQGYEIAKLLRERFAMEADPSTLYHALRRLERDGAIASCWDARERAPASRLPPDRPWTCATRRGGTTRSNSIARAWNRFSTFTPTVPRNARRATTIEIVALRAATHSGFGRCWDTDGRDCVRPFPSPRVEWRFAANELFAV